MSYRIYVLYDTPQTGIAAGQRQTTELGENEAAAIVAFHFCKDFAGEGYVGGASG